MCCTSVRGDIIDKWFNDLEIGLMEGLNISDAPPRYLHAQLQKSSLTLHLDGITELLTILLAPDRPIGDLASRSCHEEVNMYRQAAIHVTPYEEGRKGCLGVGAGVVEAAACSDCSIPIIKTIKVVRKTCENIVW